MDKQIFSTTAGLAEDEPERDRSTLNLTDGRAFHV
jgi:hypothetical protein